MRTVDICKEYGFDIYKFEKYLRDHNIKTKTGFNGMTVNDSDLPQVVSDYSKELSMTEQKEHARIEMEKQEEREELEENLRKKKALAEMLITSGFTFDGYKIKKYSGYISGDDCVTLPRDTFWGNNRVEDNLCGALVKIRRQALKELKEAAYNLGCNAVIGVDFDYLTMDPQHASGLNVGVTVYEPYVICVTANGNAVVIEKEE